ncbi:hypothetical protein [Alkalinema sp. FACHB-956]|uniref:lectin-like domain-containing protein n=1 Tax=Alkalinema sp. FACHB-956 TaxID=2692768 RepID=UPI001688B98E|nr:hypothetical protein [Alkalinema sp. FACHB-956]
MPRLTQPRLTQPRLTQPRITRLFALVPFVCGLVLLPRSAQAQTLLFQETFTGSTLTNPGLYRIVGSNNTNTVDGVIKGPSVCLTGNNNPSDPFLPGCAAGLDGLPPSGVDALSSGALRLTSNRVGFIDQGPPPRNFNTQGERGSIILNQAFPTSNGLRIEFDFFIYNGRSNGAPPGADGLSFFLLDGNVTNPTPGAFGGSLGYAQETLAGGSSSDTPGVAGGYIGIGFDEFGNFSNGTQGRVGGIGQSPDSVVLRGAGNGLGGYAYLEGRNLGPSIDDAATVNTNTPRSAVTPRRVRITLTPDSILTVEIDFTGTGTAYQTVVNQLDLKAVPGQPPVPASLKVGFAASTGFSTAIHELRNLAISDLTTPPPPPPPPPPPDGQVVQRLRLVKRITAVIRNGVRTEFNQFVNDPSTEDDTALGWNQLSTGAPIGLLNVNPIDALRSGDDIEYTIYYLADGNQPIFNVNLCDQIPEGTTYIPGSSLLSQNNSAPTAAGSFLSPLQPLPSGNACTNPSNPNGSLVYGLNTISSNPGANFGFTRFRSRIRSQV